jgi:carbon storage regulator
MLLLSRRAGERFVIQTPGGDVWVSILEIDRGKAKVGIEAPQEYAIWRQELLGRIERDQKSD